VSVKIRIGDVIPARPDLFGKMPEWVDLTTDQLRTRKPIKVEQHIVQWLHPNAASLAKQREAQPKAVGVTADEIERLAGRDWNLVATVLRVRARLPVEMSEEIMRVWDTSPRPAANDGTS
jgi:hypothetical protein